MSPSKPLPRRDLANPAMPYSAPSLRSRLLPQCTALSESLAEMGYAAWGLYGLRLLPALAALTLDWAYAAFWMASDIALATAVRWLWAGGWARRAAALAANSASVFGNLLLMLSLWLQGAGFNVQFFFHATWGTLAWGYEALAPMFHACWLYWLLLSLWPFLLKAGRSPGRAGLAAVASVGLALNAPVVSLASNAFAYAMQQRDVLLVPKTPNQAIAPRPLQSPRNLVLIFAEGLEATYGLPEVFGEDATPRLTALQSQGLRFTNMRQVSHTGWTTGAMVAAQCAFPMGPAGNFNSVVGGADLDARAPGAVCLGDILEAHGYRTIYMGGASLSFGRKGTFLAEHGFADRHGLKRLKPMLRNPSYVSNLGLHDDSLFSLTLDKLAELDGGPPFALAMLTLDTHGPFGFPSASCGPRTDEGLLFAVRCSDRLLADFIEEVRRRHPDALVALLSDHLANFNDLNRPPPPAEQRRLRFVAWGDGIAPATINRRGTHFDLTPTLMDLLGMDAWAQHNLGASLLRFDSPWFANEHPQALRLVHALPGLEAHPGDEVVFDAAGPIITLDDRRILATDRGLRLQEAVFAIAFDDDGRAVAHRSFRGANGPALLQTMQDWASGRMLIGASSHQGFNQQQLPQGIDQAAFFIGRIGADDVVVGPLSGRKQVTIP